MLEGRARRAPNSESRILCNYIPPSCPKVDIVISSYCTLQENIFIFNRPYPTLLDIVPMMIQVSDDKISFPYAPLPFVCWLMDADRQVR